MSELGVFAVDRGVFDHPVLDAGEPFTRREAWLWLLSEASWKVRPKNVAGVIVQLARGQLSHSIRFIAAAWRWDKAKVTRFLDRLKTETMIETRTETGQTVITICNYNEYQRVSLPSETPTETVGDTAARQQRDKLEDIQSIQEEVEPETRVSDAPLPKQKKPFSYPAEFEAAWRSYPVDRNMSKFRAHAAWRKLDAEDRAAVAAAIPGFVAFCRKDQTYRPVHFVKFITDRRFDGFVGEQRAKLATVDDWTKRLAYARENRKWSTSDWGPAPGADGCLVPRELLLPADGIGWDEWKRAS